jgi:hypothetical protein
MDQALRLLKQQAFITSRTPKKQWPSSILNTNLLQCTSKQLTPTETHSVPVDNRPILQTWRLILTITICNRNSTIKHNNSDLHTNRIIVLWWTSTMMIGWTNDHMIGLDQHVKTSGLLMKGIWDKTFKIKARRGSRIVVETVQYV